MADDEGDENSTVRQMVIQGEGHYRASLSHVTHVLAQSRILFHFFLDMNAGVLITWPTLIIEAAWFFFGLHPADGTVRWQRKFNQPEKSRKRRAAERRRDGEKTFTQHSPWSGVSAAGPAAVYRKRKWMNRKPVCMPSCISSFILLLKALFLV